MHNSEKLWRQTALDVILVCAWYLAIEAADPRPGGTLLPRTLLALLAAALLIGIIPGSYLDTLLRKVAPRAERASPWTVLLYALGGPLLALGLASYLGLGTLRIHQTLPEGMRDEPFVADLVSNLGMAVLQLVFLPLNIATALRRRKQ
jgi:membrane protease YdiL (CAAX protease family)